MKKISILLVVYVLALNFIPCTCDCCGDEDFCMELSFNTDTQHQHKNNPEQCHPFCMSGCCNRAISTQNTINEAVTYLTVSQEFQSFNYLVYYFPRYISIWNPPQSFFIF